MGHQAVLLACMGSAARACMKSIALRCAAAVYNSLLEICARTRDMTRGEEVVGRMARAGVLPDEDTLEVQTQGFSNP